MAYDIAPSQGEIIASELYYGATYAVPQLAMATWNDFVDLAEMGTALAGGPLTTRLYFMGVRPMSARFKFRNVDPDAVIGARIGSLLITPEAVAGMAFTGVKAVRAAEFTGDVARPLTAASKARVARLKRLGFQEHHIISTKNVATKNHELLDLAKFDPEHRSNKIFLPKEPKTHPTRSPHNGRHTQAHSDNLAEKMQNIADLGKAQGWSAKQFNTALHGLLRAERSALRSGHRILNKHFRPWATH